VTKIIKAKYKASRRLGKTVWGDAKDPFNTKNYRPGQHGPNDGASGYCWTLAENGLPNLFPIKLACLIQPQLL
jgi:hypothetical protein